MKRPGSEVPAGGMATSPSHRTGQPSVHALNFGIRELHLETLRLCFGRRRFNGMILAVDNDAEYLSSEFFLRTLKWIDSRKPRLLLGDGALCFLLHPRWIEGQGHLR